MAGTTGLEPAASAVTAVSADVVWCEMIPEIIAYHLITPNRVVRNCELLVGLRLFPGKIDHDHLRVLA
jgi:hypothetical protein